MTDQARNWLWAGIVVIVAMGLFPPWLAFHTWATSGAIHSGYTAVHTKGYAFLFSPPQGSGAFVDLSRLTVQWVIVAAITLGLVVTCNKKPTAEQLPNASLGETAPKTGSA